MTEYTISFMIQFTTDDKLNLTSMIQYIKINSMLNSQDEIISKDFGIIELLEKNIKKINNLMLKISIKVKVIKKIESLEDTKEIIYCIFPSTYNSDYIFEYTICKKNKKCETHKVYFIDVPEDIQLER